MVETGPASSPDPSALAECLHDLRAALRADDDEYVRDVLLGLAHAVRALDASNSAMALKLCARLQLLPLLRAASERYGQDSYETKLTLCVCANLAEVGGAVEVRQGGGLELIGRAIAAADAEVRYLAVAALRNQLAFDRKSLDTVLGTRLEAQLTMLLSSAVDLRTLDAATSALNTLYGIYGERAVALGVAPPLPQACADSLARCSARRRWLEALALGCTKHGGAAGGLASAEGQRLLALSLVPGQPAVAEGGASAGNGAGENGSRPHSPGLIDLAGALGRRALGGGGGVAAAGGGPAGNSGSGGADAAKLQLLLKANARRRLVAILWAALAIQAAARGHAARRTLALRLRDERKRGRAAMLIQARARSMAALRAAAAAREQRQAAALAEADARRLRARARGVVRCWLLRVRGRALVSASRHVRDVIKRAPTVRAMHEAQLARLRELRQANRLGEDELARLSSSVAAAYAALEMELPLGVQRVERLRRWLETAGSAMRATDMDDGDEHEVA